MATAATTSTLNFQARLQNAAGAIVADGTYNIEFNLYSVSTGGSTLWTEDYLNNATQGVTVQNGYVTVNLGSLTAFPSTINWDQNLYLGMTVRGTGSCTFGSCTPTDSEMTPRLQLTASAYAFKANQLAQYDGSSTFTSSLKLASTTTGGNQIFQLQDQGAGGTYNILTNMSGVQLQSSTPGTAQTGNFNISGTGIAGILQAGTSVKTSLLDTASAVALNIGTTSATQINFNQDTHVLGGKSLIVEEGSTTALQVLGGIGLTQVLTVDTTGDGRVTIGANGGCTLGADQGTICINENYTRGGVFNNTTFGLTTTLAKNDFINYTGIQDTSTAIANNIYGYYIDSHTSTNNSAIVTSFFSKVSTGQPGNFLQFQNGGNIVMAADNTGVLTASGIKIFNSARTFTGTLGIGALTQNVTYNLPVPGSTSDTVCLLSLANCASGYLLQVPTSNTAGAAGANVISPTTNSIIGLTINATTGTAATAVSIVQSQAAIGLSINSSSNTATDAINLSGTYTNLLNATNIQISNAGNLNFSGSTAHTLTVGTSGSGNGNDITINGGSAGSSTPASIVSQTITFVNNANTVSATYPTGIQVGDLMIMTVGHGFGVNNPGGWTVRDNTTGSNVNGALYTRVVQAGDIGGSQTVTFASTYYGEVGIVAVRNVTLHDFVASRSSAGTTSETIGPVNVSAGDLVVYGGMVRLSSATVGLTTGSVLAQRTTDANAGAVVGYSTAGSSGALSQTFTVNSTPTGRYYTVMSLTPSGASVGNGGNINLSAGIGSGTGVGGSVIVKNGGDSTTAFQVQTAGGTSLLNADTISMGVTVNGTLRLTGNTTANRPTSPAEGTFYYDTSTTKMLVYSNGKWQADRTTAIIVAASNSSQADKDAADYVTTGTSDQTIINSALTAGSGKQVVLLVGTYTIDGSISVPNNTTLAGVGRGTLVQMKASFGSGGIDMIINSDTSTGTGVTVRDLRVDGNNTTNNGSGLKDGVVFSGMGSGTGNSERLGGKILNVTVENIYWRGIVLSGSSNNLVSGNMISNNSAGNGPNVGISVDTTSTNNTISNNTVQGAGSGFSISGTSNTFTGNSSQFNTGAGFDINAGSTGNVYSGNVARGNSGYGFDTVFTQFNLISANKISGNAGGGINLSLNGSGASNNNSVTGNDISDNGGATTNEGIRIFSSDNNNITGNTISDTSATTTNKAIDITNSTSDNNYLSNNSLLNSGIINDSGTGTIYSNQMDANGTLLNHTNGGGLTIGTTTTSGTLSLQGGLVATQLPTPTIGTAVSTGTNNSVTWRYEITALDGTGETVASSIATNGANGATTLTGSNFNTVTWTAVPGAIQYNVYRCSGVACATFLKKTTVAGNITSFVDTSNGSPAGSPPASNTTAGATFAGVITGSSTINAVSGFQFNGTAGSTTTCTSGGVLQNGVIQGGIITGGTCIAPTLQNGYDTSSSPASILLADAKNFVITAADTSTDPSILFNLQCVTSCSTNGRFAIQNGGSDVFLVNPNSGLIRVGDATNNMTFTAGTYEPVLNGNARHTKRFTLVPEYAGATFTGDGSNNTGVLSSDFCSGTSRLSLNTGVCGATEEHNYYSWTTSAGTDQDYDIYVRYQIPSDFAGFTSNTSINMWGWRTDATNNLVELTMYNASGTACQSATNVATGTAAWTETATSGNETSDAACTAIAAGDIVIFRIRLTASPSEFARAGEIRFDYYSKW